MTRFLTVLLLAGAVAAADAQSARDYSTFTDPGQRFTLDFPRDWRWMIVSGSGEPLAAFIQPNDEAAVVVERSHLQLQLSPEEIGDVFLEIETAYVRENHPLASGITARMERVNGRPTVIIEYLRPSVRPGVQERVRQYSQPVGQKLYRITCTAAQDRFARHEATFASILATLRPAASVS